jgi:cell division transport system permease protein
MQLRYVFSETGNGLRRNVSMSIALVVTIFISLTLAGLGILLNSQAEKAESYWGSKLQITVFLCNQNMTKTTPRCAGGEATQAQENAVREVLDTHPEVKSYYKQTKAEAFKIWKKVYVADDSNQEAYSTVRVSDMQDSYWVTLQDPQKFEGVKTAVEGMDGVQRVQDLREVLQPIYFWLSVMKWGAIVIAGFLLVAAILQVSNLIRLAAFARRREIGIMRLVGASNLYIQLPFLLETLVAGLIGLVFAGGVLAAFMQFVVYDKLRPGLHIVEWVDWSDGVWAGVLIAGLAVVLTVIPTLLMTRKYLRI